MKPELTIEDRLAALVKEADFYLGNDKKGTYGNRFRQQAKQALKEYEKTKKKRDQQAA